MQMVPVILRRINRTLRVSLPATFVKERGLKIGDQALFIPEANGDVRLRFVKMTTLEELADEGEPVAEMQDAEAAE
jgi:hypothetical protein